MPIKNDELKIYYELPEAEEGEEPDNPRLMMLLYENFKYRMMWQLRSIESVIKKEGGVIFIDRNENGPELRFEGFSDKLVIVMKGLLSLMPKKEILDNEY